MLELLPTGQRHAFEFREPSWFHDDVYALLREHRVALVIGDRPEVHAFQSHELTTDFTFVRFHSGTRGRRGNYSESELEEWARRFEQWPVDVYAYFNNDWEGFAPRNALWLERGSGRGSAPRKEPFPRGFFPREHETTRRDNAYETSCSGRRGGRLRRRARLHRWHSPMARRPTNWSRAARSCMSTRGPPIVGRDAGRRRARRGTAAGDRHDGVGRRGRRGGAGARAIRFHAEETVFPHPMCGGYLVKGDDIPPPEDGDEDVADEPDPEAGATTTER